MNMLGGLPVMVFVMVGRVVVEAMLVVARTMVRVARLVVVRSFGID
jgi:hypothetical protein